MNVVDDHAAALPRCRLIGWSAAIAAIYRRSAAVVAMSIQTEGMRK
jgi:hypothetical protein